jgi:hypothetical protein
MISGSISSTSARPDMSQAPRMASASMPMSKASCAARAEPAKSRCHGHASLAFNIRS